MNVVWPHEFFRIYFDQILEDAKRQETIHPSNTGEFVIAQNMHAYFSNEVLRRIIHDDWVFDAASRFTSDYAIECFRYTRLGAREIYNTQKELHAINQKVTDFIARAQTAGGVAAKGTIQMTKASDFLTMLNLDKLPTDMRLEANDIYERAADQEALLITVTLRAIRDNFETTLPRIMYVVRRAIKVSQGLPPKISDNDLKGVSEYLDWYENKVDQRHPLSPVLGKLRDFYRVARNIGSHHTGLKWEPANNEVVLTDQTATLSMHIHEFQQRYRYLVYLCELGTRGILSAFCERERGPVSNTLVKEYVKTFPEDFPAGEEGTVRAYP